MSELATLEKYLTDVQHACAADSAKLADQEHDVAELRQLEGRAGRMLKDFVLRYGIIGDSNAGKSLLIGGLIGKANALPVNPVPFTGNITILRVRSDDTLGATTMGPYRLRFISATDAGHCITYLLDQFLEMLSGVAGMSDTVRAGRELRVELRQEIRVSPLSAWITKVWDTVAAKAGSVVDLRFRMTELARFVLAWDRFGKAVCGATAEVEVEVPREVAEAAMVLPKGTMAGTFTQFTAEFDQAIAKMFGKAGRLLTLPKPITKEFAAACYSLVRDIHVEVRMPSAVWNLRELHVDAIDLFDFPGLAAQGSAARDRYLSQLEREQNRIHTWVVVVNSTDLTGTSATSIVKELPPERVVVLANRFDDLPLRKDGYLEEVKRLTAADSPPHTQKEVVDRLLPLLPLTVLCNSLTAPERCVFVSALIGLYELDQTAAGSGNVLTPEQRTNWAADVQRGQEVQPLWARLAAKIQAAEPKAPLALWLKAYSAADGQGGLRNLRSILFEHANHVGMQQLADEMRSRLPALADSIQAFVVRVEQHMMDSQMTADTIRTRLDQLSDLYRECAIPPGNIDDARVRANGPTGNGALEAGTRILAPARTAARPLRDLIRDEVLMRVWEWPVWSVLLGAALPNGFLECAAAPAKEEEEEDYDAALSQAPPLRAGELHELYRNTYTEIERIAMAGLRSALRDFLAALSARLKPLEGDLSPLAATSPKNVVNLAIRLHDEQRTKNFFKKLSSDAPVKNPIDPFWRQCYPFLVYPDDHGGLAPGPYFGWAPQRREMVLNPTQHQIYIMRLRTELSEALAAAVGRRIAGGLLDFRERFQKMVETLHRVVTDLKAQPNANLLSLFGKAAEEPSQRVADLELRRVELPFSNANAV